MRASRLFDVTLFGLGGRGLFDEQNEKARLLSPPSTSGDQSPPRTNFGTITTSSPTQASNTNTAISIPDSLPTQPTKSKYVPSPAEEVILYLFGILTAIPGGINGFCLILRVSPIELPAKLNELYEKLQANESLEGDLLLAGQLLACTLLALSFVYVNTRLNKGFANKVSNEFKKLKKKLHQPSASLSVDALYLLAALTNALGMGAMSFAAFQAVPDLGWAVGLGGIFALLNFTVNWISRYSALPNVLPKVLNELKGTAHEHELESTLKRWPHKTGEFVLGTISGLVVLPLFGQLGWNAICAIFKLFSHEEMPSSLPSLVKQPIAILMGLVAALFYFYHNFDLIDTGIQAKKNFPHYHSLSRTKIIFNALVCLLSGASLGNVAYGIVYNNMQKSPEGNVFGFEVDTLFAWMWIILAALAAASVNMKLIALDDMENIVTVDDVDEVLQVGAHEPRVSEAADKTPENRETPSARLSMGMNG